MLSNSNDNLSDNIESYETAFNGLLNEDGFSLLQAEKTERLKPLLQQLHQHHLSHCLQYQNIFSSYDIGPFSLSGELQHYPYLAVRLFKYLSLSSVSDEVVFKTLYSSGTTSQTPAKVILDRDTAVRQSKVLVKILQGFIGKSRLPMLIIDSPDVVNGRETYSARGAGIQGLSLFGRDHTYALDNQMQLNMPVIEAFCEKYRNKPVLLFGFTFMVWKYFIQALKSKNLSFDLPDGILIHSGGWKKLEAEKVSNHSFKQTVAETLNLSRVHNFYGMAEQVGSIFVECEAGHLHTPVFADLLIRDPFTLEPLTLHQKGLIQVISTLPTSYPGHSILTEDLGVVLGVDDCACGRKGKYFSVEGRLPKTEMRGCSDTAQ
ncbi:LuxE/PaaK family acyltransferase [Alteromonas sp. a30]|uniref:LuxE/PaaK family acyltransferase n=1 Tax=Alteromonas sp. a30 TaxID=2730917 RepID=UPI00227DABC4|nr:acyl-protein synthetase [Alteromonas sp. a30]MCY7294521.1 acyl-protein synthetase [Alteromonas sp. a30]